MIRPIEWVPPGTARLLDQTRLPTEVVWIECTRPEEIAEAISTMRIRGAPAIGVAAAMGVALAAREYRGTSREELLVEVKEAAALLGATRPTAYNLFWALDRMVKRAEQARGEAGEIQEALGAEASRIMAEDEAMCRAIGDAGKELLPPGDPVRVLTHCNAGGLATAGWGTALGVVRSAHESGRRLHVYVDETRPALQGARLTAWELLQDKIPHTLIADNMAAFLMQRETIAAVIVGADRIAANGDVANKIGTYGLAVLARTHGIPFYVAAPCSTIDLLCPDGSRIPIEERDPREITHIRGIAVAPEGVRVWNPAFDVTPHRYVTAIITERGVLRPPFQESLAATYRALLTP